MAMSTGTLFFAFLIVAFAFVAFSLVLPVSGLVKLVFVIVGMVFDVLAFSTRFYFYLFMPMLKSKGKMVTLRKEDAFMLSPAGNAIVVREGDIVYASAFVKIPVYRSATEMGDEEKLDFAQLFGRMATLTKDEFRITAQMYVLNKDDYISRIRDRLNDSEDRYQKMTSDKNADKKALERVRGEVTMWHNLLDNVGRIASNSLITYAMVTAQGGTEDEALNAVARKADEISSGVSSLFGITANVAQGPEILTLVEPEYIIPSGTIAEQMKQKAYRGV